MEAQREGLSNWPKVMELAGGETRQSGSRTLLLTTEKSAMKIMEHPGNRSAIKTFTVTEMRKPARF